jgi:hypothetical protein
MFPKRKYRSTHAVGWEGVLFPGGKSEKCPIHSHPFEAAFSGIDRVSFLGGGGYFFVFI